MLKALNLPKTKKINIKGKIYKFKNLQYNNKT